MLRQSLLSGSSTVVVKLLARNLETQGFNVDPLNAIQPYEPIPLLGAIQWAKEHVNTDLTNVARPVVYAELLRKALDLKNVGMENVDLIVRGEPRSDGPNEEDRRNTNEWNSCYRDYRATYRDLLPHPFGQLAKMLEDPTFQPDTDALVAATKLMSRAGLIAAERLVAERLRLNSSRFLASTSQKSRHQQIAALAAWFLRLSTKPLFLSSRLSLSGH
ncbi:hypothetical protein K435DRAFT_851230 [Dendrothele bispora CBS 962.96]|uniref:Uncharacterized protein n=1 Tax=Dendrothele bispora (strain CBS 962.96) TaxID=1314807 RepID=A0A4S8MMD5_DENBC|nr:hypothetical protein K435DRAFT_851230 [Dendrothele bispora CBS 962.96]